MPSAVAEAEAAAMDNAVDVWRLNTASRLQRSPVYAGQSIIHAVVLYMPPRSCRRRRRDRKVVSPLWQKASISDGWSQMGSCYLKDGHGMG